MIKDDQFLSELDSMRQRHFPAATREVVLEQVMARKVQEVVLVGNIIDTQGYVAVFFQIVICAQVKGRVALGMLFLRFPDVGIKVEVC